VWEEELLLSLMEDLEGMLGVPRRRCVEVETRREWCFYGVVRILKIG